MDAPDHPPLETHFSELLRAGGGGGAKIDPPLFWVENHESFGFFSILSRKSFPGSQLHGICMGRSGMSAGVVHALFGHFCYAGSLGDLGDPVLCTLRGVSGDVVTVCDY